MHRSIRNAKDQLTMALCPSKFTRPLKVLTVKQNEKRAHPFFLSELFRVHRSICHAKDQLIMVLSGEVPLIGLICKVRAFIISDPSLPLVDVKMSSP